MRELQERLFQKGLRVNVAWLIGLIFVAWVALAFYIAITEAVESTEARAQFAAALQEREAQLELKEELEARARALGIEAAGPHAPEEVLAPSREAYLKEFWRKQRLVRPGEFIASCPLVAEKFSPSG